MAIDFASGYILKNQTLITDYPFTMACWIYPDVVNIEQAPMALIDKDSVNSYFCDLHVYADGTCGLRVFNGSFYEETTPSGAISANTWTHICGVYSSATSRSAFKNGGTKTTTTTSITLGNLDRVLTGAMLFEGQSILQPFDGKTAEVAVWNVALTDAEVAMLALGVSPRLVRPGSLKIYYPLIRDIIDFRESTSPTTLNTSASVHPRVIYSGADLLYGVPAAASGTTSKSSSDTVAVRLSEAATVSATGSAAEFCKVQTSELAAVTVSQSTADSLSVRLTETASVVLVVTTTDSIAVSLTETQSMSVTAAVLDSASVAGQESSTVSATGSASESLTVQGQDAAAVHVAFPASDTVAVRMGEVTTVSASVFPQDTVGAGASEAATVSASGRASDTVAVILLEAMTTAATVAAVDTVEVHLVEVATPVDTSGSGTPISAGDSCAISLGESATVVAVVGAADVAGLLLAEARAIVQSTMTVTDTCSVALQEDDQCSGTITASDVLEGRLDDSLGVTVPVATSDTVSISCTEGELVAVASTPAAEGEASPFIPNLSRRYQAFPHKYTIQERNRW